MKKAPYQTNDKKLLDKADYNTATEAHKMLEMLDAGGQFTFQTFADRKDSKNIYYMIC